MVNGDGVGLDGPLGWRPDHSARDSDAPQLPSWDNLSGLILLLANQTWMRRSSKAEKEPPPLHSSRDGLVSGLCESTIPAPCAPPVHVLDLFCSLLFS
jgi:hypothetical protein